MRYSSDTDRTQVQQPSGAGSADQLDTLSEKQTMESRPDGDEIGRPKTMHRRPASRDSLDMDIDPEKDLERGGMAPDTKEKEEELEKQREEQQKDPNLIEWDGLNDLDHPMNWNLSKKWAATIALGFMTFCVTFASSVFSNATVPTAKEFGVSTEVTTLGTAVFVLGYAVGPLVWGPGSEVFGRKLPLFFGYTVFVIFQIPVAVAQNLETIIVCRFIGGCFASAPLAIVGGALADFWGPVDRGVAVCVFAAATFIGPIAGPIMG
jgi:DHA1 family multidrug resistance protein-like MFS transporter